MGSNSPAISPPLGEAQMEMLSVPFEKCRHHVHFLVFPVNLDICVSRRSTAAVGVVMQGIDIYVMVGPAIQFISSYLSCFCLQHIHN